jgi:type IV pilus assembly protein PilF
MSAVSTVPQRPSEIAYAALLSLLALGGCAGVSEEMRQQSQRRYELAVNLLRTENQPRSALVELERAVRLDPENAEAQLLIGQIYGGSGLYAQAEAPLRRAVEVLRRESVEDPALAASFGEARNSLGAALISLDRPQEALPVLLEVSQDVHYPQPHLALGNLGLAYLAMRRYADAARVLERAVSARPEFCVGNYRLGEAYARMDDGPRALGALDRALASRGQGCDRIQPAFRLRAELHMREQHRDQARADLTRCRELGPDTQDGRACAQSLRTVEGP